MSATNGSAVEHIRSGAILLVVAALFTAGCRAPSADKNTQPFLFVPVFGTVGSMAFGNHMESHGVGVVERATGEVSFCQSQCSKIGKIVVAEGQTLAIYAGASDDFFVANETSGEVTSCSLELSNKKNNYDFVFQSGKCRSMPIHR